MEIDARGSEKSLSFCYLKIDNIFCVSRLTREGSGNFLTQTYLELREIENNVIREQVRIDKRQINDQIQFGDTNSNLIRVSINQFYGIEINDFAVSVAKTALWIAEHQMFEKTRAITYMKDEFLPLRTYTNIIEGNALRIDWNDVISNTKCNYIMGNPPFLGQKMQTKEQKEDMKNIFKDNPKYKRLDYVACWYKKACEYMKNTKVTCALVSTNSICQGEMINMLWKPLFNNFNIIINFAYRTFTWDSEASIKAHVHCVIVGFSYINNENKIIFDKESMIKCYNINPYLMNAPTIFLEKLQSSISGLPFISKGSQLVDGGNYVFKNINEYNEFIKKEPNAIKYIRRYTNAKEYLNGKDDSYVLYFENFEPSELNSMPQIKNRIELVKRFRENSNSQTFNELANKPTKYFVTLIPKIDSIAFPCVSSENRKYIPIGFIDKGTVLTNSMFYIESSDLWVFSLLNSNVHMAWMKIFAGRLKSDFRYSSTMVYNTFPVPKLIDDQKYKLNNAALKILEARKLYHDSTLADLYNNLTMPPELRKAHIENDKAVMEAYGFDWRKMSEDDCIAKLMEMYQKLVEEKK